MVLSAIIYIGGMNDEWTKDYDKDASFLVQSILLHFDF